MTDFLPIAQLIRLGVDLNMIYNDTKIDMFFLDKFKNITDFEQTLKSNVGDVETS